MRTLVLAALVLAGCATGANARRKASLVDDRPLVVAGVRCEGGACKCREIDQYGDTLGEATTDPSDTTASLEGVVAPGEKRFELRTGRGSDEVQITVEGRGTLRKPSEQIEPSCGYIDLPPGEHRVRVRVKAGVGQPSISPRLIIYEHGARTHSWYTSFAMSCGIDAPCTRGELDERMGALAKQHGLFDQCGSVKVKSVTWDADKRSDDLTQSFDMELVLNVYRFTPRFPRGGACKGPSPE